MGVMAKRKRIVATPVEVKLDHGPVMLIHRGELVREDRSDPDIPNRTVAGTRRRDGLRQMYRRGHLSGAEWDAAEKFRADLAFAAGAREMVDTGGIRGTSRSYGPSRLQIDAQTRVKGAMQAVGLVLSGVLSWVVISHGTIEGYAQCKSIRGERASEMLHAALDRLSGFYSGVAP